MNGDLQGSAAVFVVSAWTEPSGRPRVRARVRYSPGAGAAPQTVAAVASPEDACRLLRAWWESLSDQPAAR